MGVKVSKEIDSACSIAFRSPVCSCHSLDPSTHLIFLKSLSERIPTDKAPDAHVLLLASLAHAKLLYGDIEGTRVDMDAAWAILDSLPAVESRVRAAYYKVAADYYKVRKSSSTTLQNI